MEEDVNCSQSNKDVLQDLAADSQMKNASKKMNVLKKKDTIKI